jgi:isocitrate dehydrogenase
MQPNSSNHPSENSTSASDSTHEARSANTQSSHEALYDRFTERARQLFDAAEEKSKEAMEKAMEAAREQMSALGEFSTEQGEAFKSFMRRDLQQTAQDMRNLGKEAKERLHPARMGAGALSSIAQVLQVAGLALQSLSQRAEDVLHYNTGDVTAAGTLSCMKCEQKLHLKKTAKVPPCPSCHATVFRKGY